MSDIFQLNVVCSFIGLVLTSSETLCSKTISDKILSTYEPCNVLFLVNALNTYVYIRPPMPVFSHTLITLGASFTDKKTKNP